MNTPRIIFMPDSFLVIAGKMRFKVESRIYQFPLVVSLMVYWYYLLLQFLKLDETAIREREREREVGGVSSRITVYILIFIKNHPHFEKCDGKVFEK